MATALNLYIWQTALAEWYLIVWYVGYIIVLTMVVGLAVLWGFAAAAKAIVWLNARIDEHIHRGDGHLGVA